jgi:hypothetical protein
MTLQRVRDAHPDFIQGRRRLFEKPVEVHRPSPLIRHRRGFAASRSLRLQDWIVGAAWLTAR